METTGLGENAKNMEVEYDNSARVANSARLLDDYIADAVAYRNKIGKCGDFDQSYGPKERNKLDLFWPDEKRDAPIAMFIHGGYWQKLDRSAFSHMAKGLNERGVAVAIPSYTLCPDTTISGIIDEIRRACIILWKTFDKPITVFGHSAGGHLAACMLATRWDRIHKMLPAQLVQSALAISGIYELAPLMQTSINDALCLTEDEAKTASPHNWLIEPGQRFDAWVGSIESSEFIRQARTQTQRWRMMGATTHYREIVQANHFTAIHPLVDPQSDMVKRLLELMEPAEEPTLARFDKMAKKAEKKENKRQKEAKAETGKHEIQDNVSEESPKAANHDESTGIENVEPPVAPANDTPPAAPIDVSNEANSQDTDANLQGTSGDDLTKISGIGKVLHARLNELGFSTFEQLAELSASDQEMIEDVLDFKGRIKRENWITQARHQKAIKELAQISFD